MRGMTTACWWLWISPYYDLLCSFVSLLLVSLCHEREDGRRILMLLRLLFLSLL